MIRYIDTTEERDFSLDELIALATGLAKPMWKDSALEWDFNDMMANRFDEESWEEMASDPEHDWTDSEFSEYGWWEELSCPVQYWANCYECL